MITGSPRDMGDQLFTDPPIGMISVTGSVASAQDIMRKSAGTLKRLAFELGGTDPMIILEDANLKLAAAAVVQGRLTNGAGQICCAVKRVLVQESVYTSLLKPTRAEYHRRVAEAIESVAGQGDEQAPILALHYEKAGIHGPAFHYAMVAGDLARRRFAHREAIGFYGRALRIAERSDDPALEGLVHDVYAGCGESLQGLSDQIAALANYEAMLAHARVSGNEAAQADALNAAVDIDAAINITVPFEKLVSRIAGRRMCRDCGATHHISTLQSERCGKCGGELYIRKDDNEETVRNRLSVYSAQTEPLLGYYASKGVLHDFDGDRPIDDVFADICNLLEKFE
jgi:hypothetical protein